MDNTDLTKLIENIEDNLSSHITDIESLMKTEVGEITKLIFTKPNKTYPLTVTTEDVLNDPENIVVDVIEHSPFPAIKNLACILPKDKRDELLSKMQIGLSTIQDIKNQIISLGYTNRQVGTEITDERLKSKIPALTALEYAITQSNIGNQEVRESGSELLCMIKKLVSEIEKMDNKVVQPNEKEPQSQEKQINQYTIYGGQNIIGDNSQNSQKITKVTEPKTSKKMLYWTIVIAIVTIIGIILANWNSLF